MVVHLVDEPLCSDRLASAARRDFPGRSIFDFCNNICQQAAFLDVSFDQLIGTGKECRWNVETEPLSDLAVIYQLELGRLLDG